jgi:excisionase family DNA binding protein
MTGEKMLSPRQAAQKLNIGMQRLYALLYSGKLRGTKQGNRWVITASAVAERFQQVEEFQKLRGACAYAADK